MKPLIGIGIVTYKRPEAAMEVAEAIVRTLDHTKYDYKLVCSLDQVDTTGYEKVSELFNMISHKNFGISINKSIALMHLQECDHVFLFEDDLKPIKSGWDTLYLNIHKESGIGLFNYCPRISDYSSKISKSLQLSSGVVDFVNVHTAQIMSITKETLLKVGALDYRYNGYGYEHCDYTRRCVMAKLFPQSNYAFIRETWDYTEMINIPNTTSQQIREIQLKENSKIFAKGSPRILIPFTEIEEIIK
jgi:hypothetical protein